MLTGQNAFGHLDVEHTLLRHQPAVGIYLRDSQSELPDAAMQCGIEIEQHLRVMVFAASGMECTATITCSPPCLRAEQRLEEVAEVRLAGPRTAELEAGAPIRRWAKILTGTMPLPQLIVGGALLGALEYFVSLADFLEAGFSVLFLADVRMILASELAIGLLDLRLRGIARQTHDLVVVLKLHRPLPIHSNRGEQARILCVAASRSIIRCRRFPTLQMQDTRYS
jgi:hypothetical protein